MNNKKQEAIVKIAQMNIADELKEKLFEELLEETGANTPTVRPQAPVKEFSPKKVKELSTANFSIEKEAFTQEMGESFIDKANFPYKNDLKKAVSNPSVFRIFGNPKSHLNTYGSVTTYTRIRIGKKSFQAFVLGNVVLINSRFESEFKTYLQTGGKRESFMRNQ